VIRNRLIALSLAAFVAVGGAGSISTAAASAAKKPQPVAVTIASPNVKPGDKCAKGTAGCTRGKFSGNFFGD
jgi:hypothetical protein